MTVAETAQNGSDTTQVSVPADQIAHDALYDALSRLVGITGTVIAHVDRNTAEVHSVLERLRVEHARARDLLYPPPLPDGPEDVQVLYPHALRKRDVLIGVHPVLGHRECEVDDVEPGRVAGGIVVTFCFHDAPYQFRGDEPLMVRRPKGSES